MKEEQLGNRGIRLFRSLQLLFFTVVSALAHTMAIKRLPLEFVRDSHDFAKCVLLCLSYLMWLTVKGLSFSGYGSTRRTIARDPMTYSVTLSMR